MKVPVTDGSFLGQETCRQVVVAPSRPAPRTDTGRPMKLTTRAGGLPGQGIRRPPGAPGDTDRTRLADRVAGQLRRRGR